LEYDCLVGQKKEKLIKLADGLLKLVAQGWGTEGLTISRVARAAGVSRAWIYKYGGSLDDLIAFGADHHAHLFASLEQAPEKVPTIEEWIQLTAENFARLLDHTDRKPVVILLYFRFRGTKTLLGKRIRHVELLQARREVAEVQRLFAIPETQAKQVCEIIGNIRMGMAYGWADGELKDLATRDEVKTHFLRAIRGVLYGLKQ
jgi:AcrR family transcriptional regulator